MLGDITRRTESASANSGCCANHNRWARLSVAGRLSVPKPIRIRRRRSASDGRYGTYRKTTWSDQSQFTGLGVEHTAGDVLRLMYVSARWCRLEDLVSARFPENVDNLVDVRASSFNKVQQVSARTD